MLVAVGTPQHLEDVGDLLAHRLRVDAVLRVVLELHLAPPVGLRERLRIESVIWSAYMTTWPSTLRAARPMVWISDVSDRRNPSLSASRIATSDTSGRSRPSRSRLMPTSTSKSPSRKPAQDLDPLERVDLAVQVAHPQPKLEEVVGEVFGHLLGERGDEHPLVTVGAGADLADEVVDLPLGRAHQHLGVDEAGGPHDLLDDLRGDLDLVGARRGRQEHDLVDLLA